jgi:hypothetical protein
VILAALPSWADGAARDLGVVAGIIVALGIISSKTPVGRVLAWMYKRLFGQPVTEWLKRTIHGVIDPVVSALSDRNDLQHHENGERLQHIERRVATVEANTAVHADRLDRGSERMDVIIASLGGLQADVAALRTNPPRSQPLEPTGDPS